MHAPPFIFVADRQSLKAFALAGPESGLRLVNAFSIPESRRRTRDSLAREAASHMASLLQSHKPHRWAFAAPADINGAILERVSPAWLSTLQDNLSEDLHEVPPRALDGHFQHPEEP